MALSLMRYLFNKYKCLYACVYLILSFSVFAQETSNKAIESVALSPDIPTQNTEFHLSTNIEEIDEFIYREPKLAYEQILSISSSFEDMAVNNQLWWLLRKAQAENTLYLYEEFEETVLQACDLMEGVDDPEILSQIYLYKGNIKERKGYYNEAQNYFGKVISIAKANKLPQYFIMAKQALAYTNSLSELFEMSMVDLQDAYKEAFALDDIYLMATINETYGLIYDYLGEPEKSIGYYQKALDTYLLKGYQTKAADAIYGLASTYRSWKKYDEALKYFTLYREKINYSPSRHLKFFAAYGLGMTLAEKGDCKYALKEINRALSYEGLKDFDAELYKRQASCYIQLNQLADAEQAITKANNIYITYPELDGTRWKLEMIKVRSDLYYAAKNYPKSFDLLNEYYETYIATIKEHSSERIIKVRTSLELERKNIANALDKERMQVNLLQQEKIEQQVQEKLYLIFFIIIFVVVMCSIVIIQYRNHQKVLSLSSMDSLSNLYNRRYIFDYLEKLFVSSDPEKSGLSLLLMDIDDFKHINDTYGHPFGDQVIRTIARIGQETLRTEDLMGRVGGEEFLCVLPRIDHNISLLVAKRLLENIAKHEFITPSGDPFTTTVSIGIARINKNVLDSDMLYAQADQALYQSKRAGKNRVTIYKPKVRD